MCMPPLRVLEAVQEGERLWMIQYSLGETQYDPSVGLLPSFKHLSLSNTCLFHGGCQQIGVGMRYNNE